MDLQNFIDAEYCIDKYFDKHLTKRLDFYIDSRNAAVVSGRSTGFGLTNALAPSEDYATSVTLNVPAKDIEKLGADWQRLGARRQLLRWARCGINSSQRSWVVTLQWRMSTIG